MIRQTKRGFIVTIEESNGHVIRPIQYLFKTEAEAEEFIDGKVALSDVPISDLMAKYIETRNEGTPAKGSTYKDILSGYKRRFEAIWPGMIASELTQTDIDEYVAGRIKDAPIGVKKELGFLLYAYKSNGISPGWYIPNIKKPKTSVAYMPTDSEFKETWEFLKENERAIVRLIIFGGLRPEETYLVEPYMFDIEDAIFKIPGEIRKTKTPNNVPITPELTDALNTDFVKRMHPSERKRVSSAAARRARRNGVTFHGFRPFRRVLVSWAEDAGHPINMIALLTGHKRSGMTARYSDPVGKLIVKRDILNSIQYRFNKVIE